MKNRRFWFNCNLCLALLLASAGCRTNDVPAAKPAAGKKTSAEAKAAKKERSTVDFYLEIGPSSAANGVPVFRQNPVHVAVAPTPFLDLSSVEEASVVESLGGFMIQIRFDAHGAFVLDSLTSAYKGRRIAVFAKFPEPRWLAAPLIERRNAGGIMAFTPDADRAEAERFVRGLNNAVAEYKKRNRY